MSLSETALPSDVVRREPSPTSSLAKPSPFSENAVSARRRLDTKSWEYIWRSGVAGGFAGCVAKTAVAPLDRVKILFQANNPQFSQFSTMRMGVLTAMKAIYRTEGGKGLLRGHSATLLRIFPAASIKFLAYDQIRSTLIPSKDYETSIRRVLSGSMAGITAVSFTYPLEVIRVRLANETTQGRHTLSSICRRIFSEHQPQQSISSRNNVLGSGGIVNFYRGFLPTLLGILPYAGVSFLVHDTCSDMLRHALVAKYTTIHGKFSKRPGQQGGDGPAALRSWAQLCAGGIAGLVSQTVSYPLETIRRRMQVSGALASYRWLKLRETATLIFQERGFRGFFIGLTIGYAKMIPMTAISFYTYDRTKRILGLS